MAPPPDPTRDTRSDGNAVRAGVKRATLPASSCTQRWSIRPSNHINRVFPSLSHRDYRLLWQGNVGTYLAFMMQFTVEGWLLYELTRSPSHLSLLALCRSVPILLVSPIAGVVADRADRRRILLVAQSLALGSAMAIGAIILMGRLEGWHLLAAAAISGSAMGMFIPARQAITTELVPERHLMDAFSLHATSVGGIRIVGPQIAGLLLTIVGAALCYVAQIAGYVWGIVNHVQLRSVGGLDAEHQQGFFASLWGGITYAIGNRKVRSVFIVFLIHSVMLYPYMQFLPVFASDVLGVGAQGLGMLLASIGTGALLGSLIAGKFGRTRRKGLLMLGACLMFGLLIVVFSQSRWVWLSMVSLVGAGVGAGVLQVINATAAQTLVPNTYRGRIGSIDFMIWGLMPLGTLPISLIASLADVGVGVAIWAGLGVLTTVVLGLLSPTLRQLEY